MYARLSFWTAHHNREMAHLGMVALDAFLMQMADMLVAHAKSGRKEAGVFKVRYRAQATCTLLQ